MERQGDWLGLNGGVILGVGTCRVTCFRESEVEVWACSFPLVLILGDSKQLCLKTGHASGRDLSEEEPLGPQEGS